MTERTKMDIEMPPATLGPAITHARRGIHWLVVAHVAVGFVAALLVDTAGSKPGMASLAFGGFWFGQTTLLGIWCGLGTSDHWRRLLGVVLGIIALYLMPGLNSGDFLIEYLFLPIMGTVLVAVPLLIVRGFRVVIQVDSSPTTLASRLRFSIRHLLILTFVVACVVSFGKIVHPLILQWQFIIEVIVYATICIVVGILPVWIALATKRPVPYCIGFVIVAAVAGYYIGRAYSEVDGVWMIVTATEAVTVILSLLVVRSCGYRLVRVPKPSSRGSGLTEFTKPEIEKPDSQSSPFSQ